MSITHQRVEKRNELMDVLAAKCEIDYFLCDSGDFSHKKIYLHN